MKGVYTLISILLSLTAVAQQDSAFLKSYYIQKGDTLPYRIQYPINYEPSKTYPLIVFLHGSGARGSDNERQMTNVPGILKDKSMLSRYPCFVIAPQCAEDDVWVNFPDFPKSLKAADTPMTPAKLVLALTDSLAHAPNIDANRIYITGYSMGGEGTYDMIARRPDLFAAAVPVCPVADTSTAEKIKHIAIWDFHGAEDKVNDVSYSRIMMEALKLSGGLPRYTEYEDTGHRCWGKAYNEPDLFEWLFEQQKN